MTRTGNKDRRAFDPSYVVRQTDAFRLALAIPCKRHDARPGQPCWTIPASESLAVLPALCGRRASALPRGKR